MTDPRDNQQPEDNDLGRLLRATGRRAEPPEEVTRAVHQAVRAEWQAVVALEQAKRRRWLGLAAAACLAVAAVAVWVGMASVEMPVVNVASVARVVGDVKSDAGSWSRSKPVSEQQILHTGDELVTGASGRVALAFGGGVSVRLDHNTAIELASSDLLLLRAGAVYVDALPNQGNGRRLTIDTPVGSVQHRGTQYELRWVGRSLRIRVREGEVELTRHDGTAQSGQAGEQLTVAPDGRIAREPMRLYGQDWDWVTQTAPAFVVGDRPLSHFLTWAARELGREIVYATSESAAEAERARLHGAVPELTPQDLAAVLTTTRLRSTERDGQIVIDFEHGAR